MPGSMVHSYLPSGSGAGGLGEPIACKYVVIKMPAGPCLVLGAVKDFRYHAALVERFCREQKIASGWEHRPDTYAVYDRQTDVLGGGFMRVDHRAGKIVMYGSSAVYGRIAETELIGPILRSDPDFAAFRLVKRR